MNRILIRPRLRRSLLLQDCGDIAHLPEYYPRYLWTLLLRWLKIQDISHIHGNEMEGESSFVSCGCCYGNGALLRLI